MKLQFYIFYIFLSGCSHISSEPDNLCETTPNLQNELGIPDLIISEFLMGAWDEEDYCKPLHGTSLPGVVFKPDGEATTYEECNAILYIGSIKSWEVKNGNLLINREFNHTNKRGSYIDHSVYPIIKISSEISKYETIKRLSICEGGEYGFISNFVSSKLTI